MKTVLVLCTGNSCRSIMAEALINHLGAGAYKAVSAGSKPTGTVHPKSIETLERHGIATGTPRSKSWDEFEGQTFDLVITVCDAAALEPCPVFFGSHKKLHWSTPDPAAEGSEAEIDAAFDEAFTMLKERIEKELLAIQLSINSCFRAFDQSFRRIKYFTCIADNIETDNFPTEWAVKNETGLSYGMNEPLEAEKDKLLHGFQYFLRRYLVRDCIETFALCLDDLCFNLLLCSTSPRKINAGQTLYDTLDDSEKEFLESFRAKGVSPKDGKIALLKKRFGLELSDDNKKIIRGLKDIRDCLTHRNGIVSDRDGDAAKDNKRKFHWITLDFFIVDGETKKELPLEIGRVYENGGDLCMRFKKHTKLQNIGRPLSFTSTEVYEIAQSLQWIARRYIEEINRTQGKA